MEFKRMIASDINDIGQLAHELWPDASLSELFDDFNRMITSDNDAAFICRLEDHTPIAFAHVAIRNEYVEGTFTSPVGYLEGIYVRPAFRNRGFAKKLLTMGEGWVKDKGCVEFASDTELDNTVSQQFHKRSGFIEACRMICYVKKLEHL